MDAEAHVTISSRARPSVVLVLVLVLAATGIFAPAAGSAVRYKKLSALRVKADRAFLKGRVVQVRVRTKKTVFIRLAVVRNGKIAQAWDKTRVKKGKRTLTRQLNRTPASVSNLKLRVTAVRGKVKARAFLKLSVIAVTPPPPPRPAQPSPPFPPPPPPALPPPPPSAPGNRSPTAIALSNASVAENQPAGTTVGVLSATDPDPLDTQTFALVAGAGDSDNARFQLSGSMLQTSAVFDFEAKSSYSIRVRTTDNGGGTFEQQLTIAVTNVNEPPADIALSNASIAAGSGVRPVGTLSTTDPDAGDAFTYTLVAGTGSTDNASFQISGDALQANATFTFPTPAKSIRVRSTDAGGLSFEKVLSITVTKQNFAPTDIALTPSAVAENQPSNTVVGALSATDADLPGDSHTFSLVAGAGSTDNGSFNVAGSSLRTSASFDYEAKSSYAIRLRATDSQGASFEKQLTVTVTNVDEPPVALDDSATVLEDSGAAAVTVLVNDTDVDGGTKSIGPVTQPAHGTVAITGGGTGLTYAPNANYCNSPPGTAPDTFKYTLNGGSTATVSMTVTCVNDAPVAADTTLSGTSFAVGNTSLVVNAPGDGPPALTGPKKGIDANILAGASDVDGPNPLAVVAGSFASTAGGSVAMEADGDFTYTPPAGCSASSDSFSFTVTDGNPGTPGTTVRTVTIPITGCVWYVSNSALGNSGTSTAPFDTLAQAQSASSAAQTIFLYDGDNSSTGYGAGITLKPNQRLIGEAGDLVVGSDTLQTANAANRPTIANTNADVVTLASGDTVRGVQLDPSGAGGGVSGGAGVAGGTIDDVRIIDTGPGATQPDLELNGTTGTFNVSSLTIDNTGAGSSSTGVLLNNAGTVNFASAGTISITTSSGKGLAATGTNLGAGSVFDLIAATGSSTGAISMVNTTGTTSLGDGSGSDLSLQTTSGATAAFVLDNAGNVTVPAGGTANVSATGGPAIDVSNTSGPSLSFDTVDSTSSAGNAITLNGLGSGTFSATGGTLSGFAGTAFSLTGGSGAITYPGAINDGPGASALITGRSGGVVTLSGSITDGSDAGGGISVVSNSGGSTVLSGPAKTFSTGAAGAVSLSASSGHTLSISNGGLDIATTTGAGLSASSGGTLNVTGTGNAIATTTGPALAMDSADIGANDVTFQRLSTNGAANGIRLNHTGTSGRLVVTGNGGTCTNATTSGCSGGQIANSAGADDSGALPAGTGIVLNDTKNPSLTRIWIHDHSNYAIRGHDVAGFTLDNSVVNGTNGTTSATPFNDASVAFDNLTGAATVSNSDIRGGFGDNVRVNNAAGSLDRITFSSDTIGDNNATNGNDAVQLQSQAAAGALKATIQNSTFTGARGDLVDYSHNASGLGDLVLTSNQFSNNHSGIATGGGGLTLSNNGTSGAMTMSIAGNTFRDAVGNGLTVVKTTGSSSQTGTFSGNTIGVSGTANSGSAEGDGLKLQSVGQGQLNWTVTNNQVHGYNNFGIEVLAGGGASAQGGTINATITGNTIDQPGTTPGTITLPKNGIHLNIGTVGPTPAADSYQACAVITGNSLASAGAPGMGVGGGEDIRLRQRMATTIRLPGYAGSNTDTAAVASFLVSKNPTGGPSAIASVSVPPGGGFTGTGSSCP